MFRRCKIYTRAFFSCLDAPRAFTRATVRSAFPYSCRFPFSPSPGPSFERFGSHRQAPACVSRVQEATRRLFTLRSLPRHPIPIRTLACARSFKNVCARATRALSCMHTRTHASVFSAACALPRGLRWACAAYWPHTLFSFPHRVIYYGVPRVSAAEHRRRSSPADARRRQGGPLHGPPGDPDLLQVRGLVLLNLRCVRDSNPPLPSVTMPRLCPAYVLPTPRFCILMRLICPLHVDTLLTCALSCACYCIPFLCVSFGPVFFAPLHSVPFRSVSFHFIPFRFVRSVPLRPFRSVPFLFRFVPHCSLTARWFPPLPCSIRFRSVLF